MLIVNGILWRKIDSKTLEAWTEEASVILCLKILRAYWNGGLSRVLRKSVEKQLEGVDRAYIDKNEKVKSLSEISGAIIRELRDKEKEFESDRWNDSLRYEVERLRDRISDNRTELENYITGQNWYIFSLLSGIYSEIQLARKV